MEAETVEWPSPAALDQCINWGTGGTHTFVGRLISDARFVADPGLLGAHPVKRQNILKHCSAQWGALHDSCRKIATLAHVLPWQDSLLSQLSSHPINRAVLQTSQIWMKDYFSFSFFSIFIDRFVFASKYFVIASWFLICSWFQGMLYRNGTPNLKQDWHQHCV